MQPFRDKIWESALRSIQARMTSRHELKKKLLLKFPEEDRTIDTVLDEMTRVQLLNDKRYTEQLIHHLTQKPIGRLKLALETRKRGLDSELVDSLLLSAGYDEREMAQQALGEKEASVRETDPRLSRSRNDEARKRKFKLMNFLRNRGFTDVTIYSVLRHEE